MSELRTSLLKELYENDFAHVQNCTVEENMKYNNSDSNELPDNVEQNPAYDVPPRYIKYIKGDLTDEEIKIMLLMKQNRHLKTIKNCIIFFVVLAVIGIILGIVGFSQLSHTLHSIY